MQTKAVYGGLDPTTSPEDFILGAADNVLVMISSRPKQDDIVYQKNQARAKRYHYTCTITSAILAICDVFNEDMSDTELNAVCEEAISQGLDPLFGWSFFKAVDCARHYWNRTRPDKRVVSFRMDYGSREYFSGLVNGYSLVCGFQGNADYNRDREGDGSISGVSFPNPTYGHCVRKIQNSGIKIVDNYAGVERYNIYALENPEGLQNNKVYYKDHYVFLRLEDLTLSQKCRLEGKRRKIWNGERENASATRQEAVLMAMRSVPVDNPLSVPLEDLAVGIGVWNGKAANCICTRLEANEMISRALGIKAPVISAPGTAVTRGEVVELIIRSLS